MTFKVSKQGINVFNASAKDMLLDGDRTMFKLFKRVSITLNLPADTLAPNEHKYYDTFVDIGTQGIFMVLPRVFDARGDPDFSPGVFEAEVDLNIHPQRMILPSVITDKYQLVWMFVKNGKLYLAATRDNFNNSNNVDYPAQTFKYTGMVFLPSLD